MSKLRYIPMKEFSRAALYKKTALKCFPEFLLFEASHLKSALCCSFVKNIHARFAPRGTCGVMYTRLRSKVSFFDSFLKSLCTDT